MTQVVALRTFEDPAENRIQSIHSPSFGMDVYDGQGVLAQIRVSAEDSEFSPLLPIFRLSPLGAEINISDLESTTFVENFKCGVEIDVRIQIAKQICEFFGLVVVSRHKEAGKSIIAIRWCESRNQETFDLERRKTPRWLCGEEFLPTGIAPNPSRFNDFIYFKVVDLSSDGMQISTSLRNKLLIPGMVLESVISFPLIGQISVKLKLLNARIRTEGTKDKLSLGVTILSTDRKTLETVGQYVLQFGPSVSVKELKESGLLIKSAESAIDFSYVKTADEYKEVLELRKQAYSQVGKADRDIPIESMGDVYDTQARIVMARHKGKLVGSLRIMFHSPDEKCEYEEFLELPETFPKKTDMVVASRVCTHPDYRGSDLVYGLIRQLVLVSIQSKRRYILGGSTDKLLPLYLKLGLRATNVRFEHGSLNKVSEQLILGDSVEMMTGTNSTIAAWSTVFSDLCEYITEYNDVELTPLMSFRLNTYKALSPIVRLFSKG